MVKPKRQRLTDMEIAKRFKRGVSMGTIAYSLDNPYGERWDVWKVEAAIRRVMKRLDKEHG